MVIRHGMRRHRLGGGTSWCCCTGSGRTGDTLCPELQSQWPPVVFAQQCDAVANGRYSSLNDDSLARQRDLF